MTSACPVFTHNPNAASCQLAPPEAVKNDRYICDDHTCADGSGGDEGPPARAAGTQQRIAVGRQQNAEAVPAPKPAVAAAPQPEVEVVEVVEEVVEAPPTLVTRVLTVTQMVTIETTDWVTATPGAGLLRRGEEGHSHRRRHVHGH